ncbi:NAD(P)-binding domain-containing protein [Rhizobium sp. RHZ02]|uniref:pyrroline-5-carboxylate reductase family protein n=1 Tax=Rhizobium sp. RHZ02 TaxID=2769306 RepID=UPI00177FB0C8|nr:pyrroline-5-carboxylate reductase dimerization domain-containing protein [Rhizobium sp. RHZ02]MBD9451173.1 NAD(P)-binding domain-containing protein [Rhizobium sp. RHZ02]
MSGKARIGIIGGAGWLGGSIAEAILRTGLADPDDLTLSYRRSRPDRFAASHWTTDNQLLADRSDVVILSVRPEDWASVPVMLERKLLISIMAGIRISALIERHATERVVRALPNAAAEVSCSYTPWMASAGVDTDDRSLVRKIFGACGVEDEVGIETQIDYLTGMSGTGPAFPALLAAAMMKHAISQGLPGEIARRAVLTMLTGTGRLLERQQDDPAEIVNRFLEYRGVTAAGIEEMRASGFDDAVSNGLSAAFKKSVSMGDAS